MKQYAVDYDHRLHYRYHEGRRHDESVMQLWQNRIRRCVGARSGLLVLDLGSGTGRFSALLADELASDVIGIEPSDRMRAVAERECAHPRVTFLKGSADAIPLDDASCDVAWLSQVLHHFDDIGAAARELARVVREGGLVIIRNNFQGRLAGSCRYYEYFPAGLAVDEARHPTIQHVCECFEKHGFRCVSCEVVEQMEAASLKEYAERIRLRTYSTLELISDEQYENGLAALQAAAALEQNPQAVMARIDLLVFEPPLRRTDDHPFVARRFHRMHRHDDQPRRVLPRPQPGCDNGRGPSAGEPLVEVEAGAIVTPE